MVHNLVNFHFFAYLCIRNQAKKNNGKGIRIWYVGCRKQLHRPHQESPHRQGIDHLGEGWHLHCRLRVRALV